MLQVDGKRFDLSAGDAFLIHAEQISYYEASADNPWSYSWAGFTGLRAAQYVRQIGILAPERYVLRGLDIQKYTVPINEVAQFSGSNAVHYFQTKKVLFELFSCLASDLPGLGEAQYAPSLAARVKFYLDAMYSEQLQISDVAQYFHVHPNHLSRAFQREFGIAPKQYLQKIKLEKAAQMLRSTDMPISLIAASLGFEDQHAFSKTFKKHWSLSPLDYRKGGQK
jgi:AraC-like DNA-binding protein